MEFSNPTERPYPLAISSRPLKRKHNPILARGIERFGFLACWCPGKKAIEQKSGLFNLVQPKEKQPPAVRSEPIIISNLIKMSQQVQDHERTNQVILSAIFNTLTMNDLVSVEIKRCCQRFALIGRLKENVQKYIACEVI